MNMGQPRATHGEFRLKKLLNNPINKKLMKKLKISRPIYRRKKRNLKTIKRKTMVLGQAASKATTILTSWSNKRSCKQSK